MRARGMTFKQIADELRGRGFQISHQSVKDILDRRERAEAAE